VQEVSGKGKTPMPFQTVPQLDLRYALITFDKDGKERTDDPQGGVFSRAIEEHVKTTQPTHILLFSHGWKGDVPGAIDQYNRWMGAMWKLTADKSSVGEPFKPLFIGLHWPSLPWGDESIAALAPSFSTGGPAAIDPILAAAVEHFGGGAQVEQALEVIFRAFEADPAARILPEDVVAAYHDLADAIGFKGGESADAPPDHEGAELDPQAAVRAERMASAGEAFGLASTFRNGILAGLRQTSVWLMKHRARTIGEQGMHPFVSRLQQLSNADVHLMGHSFGCIVVSSILGGPGGTGRLTRPVNSAFLVQGAMSLWSFADKVPDTDKPGYFRHVVGKGAVSGPIVTTQSAKDSAVGTAFPAAMGLVNEVDFAPTAKLPKFGGIGTWGIQGTTLAEKKPMGSPTTVYEFKPGRIYNLEGTQFIPDHSGIDGPEVAHTLWQTLRAAEGRTQ
jgi:hypothetical protein